MNTRKFPFSPPYPSTTYLAPTGNRRGKRLDRRSIGRPMTLSFVPIQGTLSFVKSKAAVFARLYKIAHTEPSVDKCITPQGQFQTKKFVHFNG